MAIPGNANLLLLTEAAGAAPTGYTIDRSVRFNSADSAYLNRTPASAGNRKTWTWSAWVKRGNLGTQQTLFNCYTSGDVYSAIRFLSGDNLQISQDNGGTYPMDVRSTMVFRDPSAWYHLIFAVDTTQATSTDRVKLYVNGAQITSFSTTNYPAQNLDTNINRAASHTIGEVASSQYLNAYLADVHFIDGQALAATDFGEFDANNVWQPIEYAGTYGTNGFHLDFSDATSTTTIAEDSSGNNNDWTANNISVSAGAGNDSLFDSPQNGTQTDSGLGGELSGNYATLNPLQTDNGSYSEGNLKFTGSSGDWDTTRSTFGVKTGKWYWDVLTSSNPQFGIITEKSTGTIDSKPSGTIVIRQDRHWIDGTLTTGQSYFTGGQVVGFALDLDSGTKTLKIYANGSLTGTINLPTGSYWDDAYVFPGVAVYGPDGQTVTYNFGQRAFAYAAPSGYLTMNTANLDDPTIADGSTAMDIALWTGNGSSQSITGLSMSPDLVWVKQRNTDRDHCLCDIVRGTSKRLRSNTTDAETTESVVTAFNSDGFNIGSDNGVNQSGGTFVGWSWDGGSSTVSNTDGSITSSVRANASAGFSITAVTMPSSGDPTIGHGLGVKPEFIIFKSRTTAEKWYISHKGLTNQSDRFLRFDTDPEITNANWFASTAPTSSVITLRVGGAVSANQDVIIYSWTSVEGYSAFGSYTGNGSSDGPFVYTGHRSRWLLIKASTVVDNWKIVDTERDSYNVAGTLLLPSASNAEIAKTGYEIDICSNGFKVRNATSAFNSNTQTYIWASFAEDPFKTSRAR